MFFYLIGTDLLCWCDWHLQIRDYQLALREGDYRTIKATQMRLLIILVSLEKSPYHYIRVMLLSRLHLHYLEENLPPVFAFYKDNIRSFNEEDGEISLSLMQSVSGTNSVRGSHLRLSGYFQLLHRVRETTATVAESFGVQRNGGKARRLPFDARLTENRLVTYFGTLIHNLRQNRASHSAWPPNSPKASLPRAQAVR